MCFTQLEHTLNVTCMKPFQSPWSDLLGVQALTVVGTLLFVFGFLFLLFGLCLFVLKLQFCSNSLVLVAIHSLALTIVYIFFKQTQGNKICTR